MCFEVPTSDLKIFVSSKLLMTAKPFVNMMIGHIDATFMYIYNEIPS